MTPEEAALQVALTPVGRELDPTVRQWLKTGFAVYQRTRGASLERSLGLSRDRRARDAHIREAARFLPGGPYRKARALAPLTRAPERLHRVPGPVGVALRQAFAAGRMPTSVDQLARILKRAA